MNARLQGKAWRGIRMTLVLFIALSIAACRKSSAPAGESGLFAGEAAQNALEKIVSKLPAAGRVFSIEIQPTEMIVLVRSAEAPNHVDEYRYRTASYRDGTRQLFSMAGVVGPRPAQPVMINSNLEENLFDLSEVSLANVAETSREASRRVALEGGGAVASIRIQRQVSIFPIPQSGAVEWDISVSGPRESASAVADAKGNIRHLDISRTSRAQRLDLTQGGAPLIEAVAQIREHFGGGPVFVSFNVSARTVSFKIRDSGTSGARLGYNWGINGIQQSSELFSPAMLQRMGEGVREDQLFAIDDVDWSRLPALRGIALEKAAMPEGRITSIDVDRPSTIAGAKPVRWKFAVAADVFGENSTVEFDAKSGELTRLNSPKSLQTAINFLDPEAARRAIAAIGQELSRATGFAKIRLSQTQASITAVTTEQPNSPRDFIYSEKDGLRPFGFAKSPNPFAKDFTQDWLFHIAELEPVFPLLGDLQRKTLDRLRLSEGAVDRVTFYRHSVFYPRNRKLLVEVWVENPQRENGGVIYDLQGAELDVVGGQPLPPPDAGSQPAASAKLKPLGITDATPARVARFDALLASYSSVAQKYNETRWGKMRVSDPDKLPGLPKEAFREWTREQRKLLECVTQILKVFAERTPPSDAIASSKAAPHARTREYWERQHQLWNVTCQQSPLLDTNFDEWVTHDFPEEEAQLKPWQKEVTQLQSEIDAAHQRMNELSPPPGGINP